MILIDYFLSEQLVLCFTNMWLGISYLTKANLALIVYILYQLKKPNSQHLFIYYSRK